MRIATVEPVIGRNPETPLEVRFLPSVQLFWAALRDQGVTLSSLKEDGLVPVDAIHVSINDCDANLRLATTCPAPLIVYSTYGTRAKGGLTLRQKMWLRKHRRQILFAYATDSGPTTRSVFSRIGITYFHMPHSTDADVMRPLPNVRKDLDWVFVGTADDYRINVIAEFCARFPDARFAIVGLGWNVSPASGFSSEQIEWGEQLNALYQRARVCLNLHTMEQVENPKLHHVNQRLFDLAAAGAIQVVDNGRNVREFFPGSQNAVFAADSPSEFVSLFAEASNVSALDSGEVQHLTHSARQIVVQKHTHDIRAAQFRSAIQATLFGETPPQP